MFLTMMSERLFEFDTEPELLEAFDSFDDGGARWVGESRRDAEVVRRVGGSDE